MLVHGSERVSRKRPRCCRATRPRVVPGVCIGLRPGKARGVLQMAIRMAVKSPRHPILVRHAEERARDVQNRIADFVTRFAGSMPFVYIHAVFFAAWITSGIESFPYGLLTMIVSLEAIFLSTFVMISQNRADEKRQALADHEWEIVQLEKKQNEDLLDLSQQLLFLTKEVHTMTSRVQELVQGPGEAGPKSGG